MCIRRLFSEPRCGNTFLRDVMYQLLTPYSDWSQQIKKAKNGKPPGKSQVTDEAYKAMTEETKQALKHSVTTTPEFWINKSGMKPVMPTIGRVFV